MLEHPLMDKKHIKIGIALKRYCVYAQIVDVLIETMANSLGENIYANRTSLVMANLLYTFAVHHPNQKMVEDFEKAFVTVIRNHDAQSIRDFYSKTWELQNSSDTGKEFRNMLGLVTASRFTVADSFTSDKFYLDNTLTVFVGLVFAWNK